MAFHGEYREIVPDERLVYTEVAEGSPAPTAVKTFTVSDASAGAGVGARTTLRLLVPHESRQGRDSYLQMMEQGLQGALDGLERVCLGPHRAAGAGRWPD